MNLDPDFSFVYCFFEEGEGFGVVSDWKCFAVGEEKSMNVI